MAGLYGMLKRGVKMKEEEIEKRTQNRFSEEGRKMCQKFVSDKEKLEALEAVLSTGTVKAKKAGNIIKTQAVLLKVLSLIVFIQLIGSFAALSYLIFFK